MCLTLKTISYVSGHTDDSNKGINMTQLSDWRRKWQPTPVFLPRESCGQRSLVGCCPQGHTELDMTEATQHACMHWRRKWQPTPVFLPGESQGQRSLVGWHLWGHTESDTTEATQQQQQHIYLQEIGQINYCLLFDIFVFKHKYLKLCFKLLDTEMFVVQ